MTIRRGIYVNKGAGQILSVQVYYGPSVSSPMDIETYKSNHIDPRAESLPDVTSYHRFRAEVRQRELTLADCDQLVNHVVQVKISGQIFDGVLLGLDSGGAVSATPEGPVKLWEMLVSNGQRIAFYPLDRMVKLTLP